MTPHDAEILSFIEELDTVKIKEGWVPPLAGGALAGGATGAALAASRAEEGEKLRAGALGGAAGAGLGAAGGLAGAVTGGIGGSLAGIARHGSDIGQRMTNSQVLKTLPYAIGGMGVGTLAGGALGGVAGAHLARRPPREEELEKAAALGLMMGGGAMAGGTTGAIIAAKRAEEGERLRAAAMGGVAGAGLGALGAGIGGIAGGVGGIGLGSAVTNPPRGNFSKLKAIVPYARGGVALGSAAGAGIGGLMGGAGASEVNEAIRRRQAAPEGEKVAFSPEAAEEYMQEKGASAMAAIGSGIRAGYKGVKSVASNLMDGKKVNGLKGALDTVTDPMSKAYNASKKQSVNIAKRPLKEGGKAAKSRSMDTAVGVGTTAAGAAGAAGIGGYAVS
jgi:hypothetical protein